MMRYLPFSANVSMSSLTVVIVFGVNVDTVAIANNLLQSQAVNQQLSKIPSDIPIGAMYAATPAPGTTEGEAQQISRQQALHFQQVVALLNSLNLPIGWPDRDFFDPTKTIDLDWWLKKWVGLGLTILAVWQSSGLWFDLISRFTDLRSSGPRPKRSSGVRDKA